MQRRSGHACVKARGWLLLCLWLCTAVWAVPPAEVHILSTGHDTHLELIQSLEAALYEAPRAVRTVRLKPFTLGADGERPAGFGADASALVITVGTRATEAALRGPTLRTPLVATFIPQTHWVQLSAGRPPAPATTAFYLDQPAHRQIAFTQLVLPRAKRIGTLLGPESEPQGAALGAAAKRAGLEFTPVLVPREDALPHALRVLGEQRDAYLITYAPDIVTPYTAKWVLYSAYEHQLPVIAYSRAFAEAGAIAAVFTEPRQLGRQVGTWLREWAGTGAPLPAPQYPAAFTVAVNRTVARNLGLPQPDEHILESELRAAEARLVPPP